MHKISEKAAKAFYNREKFKQDNTEVQDGVMYLFGNRIAWKTNRGCAPGLYFSLCGWNTVTTRERLRALGICISSKNGMATVYTPNCTVALGDKGVYYLNEDGSDIECVQARDYTGSVETLLPTIDI